MRAVKKTQPGDVSENGAFDVSAAITYFTQLRLIHNDTKSWMVYIANLGPVLTTVGYVTKAVHHNLIIRNTKKWTS